MARLRVSSDRRGILLEVIEEVTGRRSTLVASQFPFDLWLAAMAGPTLGEASTNRLLPADHRMTSMDPPMRRRQPRPRERTDRMRNASPDPQPASPGEEATTTLDAPAYLPNAPGPAREGFTCDACGRFVATAVEGLFSTPRAGSPRRFCDSACRVAAWRRRKAGVSEDTPLQRRGGRSRRLREPSQLDGLP